MSIADTETLGCGCIVGNTTDTFYIQPCSAACANYRFVLSESARLALPVRRIEDPEEES